MSDPNVMDLLLTGMNAVERKVERRLVEEVIAEFEKSPELVFESPLGETALLAEQLHEFLCNRVAEQLSTVFRLRLQYAEYLKRYARAIDPRDAQRHVLEFAGELGSTGRELRRDRKALGRWFGHDAVCERYTFRSSSLERQLTFALKRIGALAEVILTRATEAGKAPGQWEKLGLESKLRPLLAYDGDERVCVAAFSAFARALKALPAELQGRSVQESTSQFIYRSAMHPRLDVWLQCEAIALLESLSTTSFERVLRQRLEHPSPGDDLFVRKRAVELLGRNLHRLPSLSDLLETAAADASPFVRQALAAAIPAAPDAIVRKWFCRIAADDPAAQVRGAALLEGLRILERPDLRSEVLRVLDLVLREEKDPLVLRAAVHVAAEGTSRLREVGDPLLRAWHGGMMRSLERLHVDSDDLPVKRYAAQARERIWCETDPRARALKGTFSACLGTLERSETALLSEDLLDMRDPDLAGRVLSVLSQEDFGYDVVLRSDGVQVTRGERFGLRAWRILHELRNPSPDKRQAHRHTIGRIFRGTLRAPSTVMCELAETRVPGEPLCIAEEGGWRPYLPLLDDFLSCLPVVGSPETARIYSSEGITEIVPPASRLRRTLSRARIALQFPKLAKLRNWKSSLQESPADYLRAMQELGFKVAYHPYRDAQREPTSVDPDVARFFPAALPFLPEDFLHDIEEYFFSAYGNSLFELALFAGAASVLFAGRHVYANASTRRSRNRIPLVIGGWGTRGKSGTERLKAALINALGYSLISKTTGCEAMFLFAPPFGETRELFLFRSYDKATIWEQRNVLRLADLLHADVFLWECMALTPAYVEVLQRHWVRDDISTITNTYPDHEDLQGPAGYNIPEVISIFTPPKGRLVTTEDMMAPILAEEAKRQETRLQKVSWTESALLAPDVLARFPYDEHPNNIALVLNVADDLGVPRDFALKEMADRVVADLGVLKTYPTSAVCGRWLQFTNGMSANERHGAISNWKRCGFDRIDPVEEPGTWVTTVVNNRADRVPRSRVFARLLVEDLSADRHFLIGGNLTGMVGYIHSAWEAHASTLTLWPKESKGGPLDVLLKKARHFRLPTEKPHVVARLRAMLHGRDLEDAVWTAVEAAAGEPARLREQLEAAGVGERIDDILLHHEQNLKALEEYEALATKIQRAGGGEHSHLDDEFRAFLWRWFEKKLVVVEDYYVSGEKLLDLIARGTPPGFLNRIMGIQNIKGTGLDFVYRWQAWNVCHEACVQIQSEDVQEVEKGLRTLGSFQEYGVLSREYVKETLEAVKGSPGLQHEGLQAQLAMIASSYELAMTSLNEKLQAVQKQASRFEKMLGAVEAFFDAGDAVKRRKLANRIYKDLAAQRISTEKAAYELKLLNKRQKGGWLLEKYRTAQRAVARAIRKWVARAVK